MVKVYGTKTLFFSTLYFILHSSVLFLYALFIFEMCITIMNLTIGLSISNIQVIKCSSIRAGASGNPAFQRKLQINCESFRRPGKKSYFCPCCASLTNIPRAHLELQGKLTKTGSARANALWPLLPFAFVIFLTSHGTAFRSIWVAPPAQKKLPNVSCMKVKVQRGSLVSIFHMSHCFILRELRTRKGKN